MDGSTRAASRDYVKFRLYRASWTITPPEAYILYVFTDVTYVDYYTLQFFNLDKNDGRPLDKVTNASQRVRVEL